MKPFLFRRSKIACFCGDYSTENKLYSLIDNAVTDGIECFLFSAEAENGFAFARQVLLRKKKQKGNKADKISLVAVVTNEHFADEKDEKFREEYFDIVAQCDDIINLNSTEVFAAEKFMLGKSCVIIK